MATNKQRAAARENGVVIEGLDAAGTAVFPADDAYTPLWRRMAGTRRVLSFSDSAPAGLKLQIGRFRPGFGRLNTIHLHDLPQAPRPPRRGRRGFRVANALGYRGGD